MGCATCANNDGSGTPTGCRNNGTCSSGGCNKLEVFDWLANMEVPAGRKAFDCVEVRFKNSRKSFFRNINTLDINVGDVLETDEILSLSTIEETSDKATKVENTTNENTPSLEEEMNDYLPKNS